MTLEMKRTLLVMGGFCVAIILVEEICSPESWTRRFSISSNTTTVPISLGQLAVDRLVQDYPSMFGVEMTVNKEVENLDTVGKEGFLGAAESSEERADEIRGGGSEDMELGGGMRGLGSEGAEISIGMRSGSRETEDIQRDGEIGDSGNDVIGTANGVGDGSSTDTAEGMRNTDGGNVEAGTTPEIGIGGVAESETETNDEDGEDEISTISDVDSTSSSDNSITEYGAGETETDSSEEDEISNDAKDLLVRGSEDEIDPEEDVGDQKHMVVNDIEEEEEEEEEDEEEVERLQRSPYIYNEEEEVWKLNHPPKLETMKLISEWKIKGPYRHSFEICRYKMCRWEPDLSRADGVLFRAAAVRTYIIEPFKRKPGQRWIMYTNDPAVKMYGFDREDVGENFNATTTYQLHSPYRRLFGQLRKIKTPKKNYEKIYEGKTRHIAWFVSHCDTWSKRENYVERMRKIIAVDVFGRCGNMTCGLYHRRRNDSSTCLPMLSQQYKFYLAFENSFCKDYVSEKFFKLFQEVDIIPVVQGGFQYKKYMPSNIFVDSSDFPSPEALANYLLKLSNDRDRYVKMLRRKAGWTYRGSEAMHCVICEKLHTDTGTHVIKDLFAAFNGKPSDCYPPPWMSLQ